MITIISATNRPKSNTLKTAQFYSQLLEKQNIKSEILSLENVPNDIAFNELFSKRSVAFQQLLDKCIAPIQKFVIIAPEYNGSYPGILKVFIDAIHPNLFKGKKVALIGVSTGRAGNLRGLDHLAAILNYLGLCVLPNKLPISNISTLIDENDAIIDVNTILALEKHSQEFNCF